MRKGLRACLSAALTATLTMAPAGASEAAADSPAIIDLGTLPGGYSSSTIGLNNADTVIGYSNRGSTNGATSHPVKWNAAGVISALPIPPGDTNSKHRVVDINDSGVIVGNSVNTDTIGPTDRGLRWSADGTVKTLTPLPGDTSSRASAVTADGTAMGQSWGDTYPNRVVLWAPDGTVTALPMPAGYNKTSGMAVNDSKTVVGYADGPGKPSLTLRWNPDGTYVDIRAQVNFPYIINNAGAVVGWGPNSRGAKLNPDGTAVDLGSFGLPTSLNAAGAMAGGVGNPPYWQPTRWAPDGTVTTLPRLPDDELGRAADINDHNITVGYSADLLSLYVQELHAVYWTPDGTVVPLGALPGGRRSSAGAINSRGTVAGNSGSAHGDRAVLWRL